jgi:2-dehydropantoate 2-reductase
MRYIIYGAGGIGGVIGGHLARTGHDVVLIGRPGHVSAIERNGLNLVTPDGAYNLKIPAITECDHIKFTPDDVICLTMKGQNTEEAMQVLKKETADVPVFCFQNGVRNEEIVSRYFSRVYGVMVRVGAEYLKDGEVIARRDPPGWFVIGRYPKGVDQLSEDVAAGLRAASFIVKTSEDVMPYKWGKLMSNLNNAIDAITGTGGREAARQLSQAAEKELIDALAQAGIKWISQEELSKEIPETNTVRGSLNTGGGSSTWQSLTREQGSVETEFLNGEVVRLCQRLGRKAPVNEMLLRISQEMAEKHEKPGRYTADQLISIVGK